MQNARAAREDDTMVFDALAWPPTSTEWIDYVRKPDVGPHAVAVLRRLLDAWHASEKSGDESTLDGLQDTNEQLAALYVVIERKVPGALDLLLRIQCEPEEFEDAAFGDLLADVWERYQDTTLRNVFYLLRHRRSEPGLIIEHKETGVFDNQPVEIVDVTDASNRVVTLYLHRTTKLPVRQVFYRRDNMKVRHEEITIFAKYRDVGNGVKWPWNIVRNRDGEKIFEIFSDQVSINKKLDPKLFELPADMVRLKAL